MRILICLFFTLASNALLSQNLEWALHMGNGSENQSQDMVVAPNGKVYFLGISEPGPMDLNPNGTPVTFSSSISNASGETFVSKYDANSNLEWWFTLEKSGMLNEKIAIDSSESLIYFGTYNGTIDFDPGPGVTQLSTIGTNTNWFLAKYSAAGTFEWVTDFPTSQWGQLPRIFTDANDNIYAHLYGEDTLRKFDSNGNLLWQLHSDGMPVFNGSDKIYWIKGFTEELEFHNSFYGSAIDSLVMTIVDTSGILVDNKLIATCPANGLVAGKLVYDLSGNIILHGWFYGSWSYFGLNDTSSIESFAQGLIGQTGWGPVPREFMAKTDLNGNVKWTKQQAYPLSGGAPSPPWISTDEEGTIYIFGQGYSWRNFDWDDSTRYPINKFVYIAEYDSSFNYQGMTPILHQGLVGSPLRIPILKQDTLYMACTFYSSIKAGFGVEYDTYGSLDILIAKYPDFQVVGFPANVEENQEKINLVQVYPNPSNGIFNVKSNSGEPLDLAVYDISGKILISKQFVNDESFDLSEYQTGVYILLVRSENKSQQVKLINY